MSIPLQIRAELADTLEDIGGAMTILRESNDDIKSNREDVAKICASDALELIASLETRFAEITAKLARWSEN